ncbi:phthiocerol/phthiodiolone dimycocerosyl transferase family protein [Gordonia polyisoprenivorans]|uniref:phthiocerol/phthiodiolone dimycocerosyl transferase family protein n=1 Tax=Gordonia polyisoprenivorans TaxID=84595 RepID=UPI00036785AE|nr:acyltransferase [Gordonia polyisoprenivorans]
MSASAVIRHLAKSEEMFAETHNFVGLGAHLDGPVDTDALAEAFDTLLEVHPALGGHLERDADQRWQIVVDDLMHPGIMVVDNRDGSAEVVPPHFDQTETLVHLRVVVLDGGAQPTLYVHHSLADGHHQFALIEELFSYYTDLVTTGDLRPGPVEPAPDSLETVLAHRGITKLHRSGLERFMPALFAYELPPSRRTTSTARPSAPQQVPMAWCGLDERQTRAIVDYARSNCVGLNGVLAAVILIAEWQVRGRRRIPVPYIYPVDLRYVLSPPVTATAATNPVGVGTFLADIDHGTDVLDLATRIAEAYRADLAEGVIAQSLLHFTPSYEGNPPGLPDVVMMTDNGVVPPMRTPPGVRLTAVHGELHFQVGGGIEMYTSKIFDGRLMIEYHTHGPDPQRSIDAIATLLAGIAAPADPVIGAGALR